MLGHKSESGLMRKDPDTVGSQGEDTLQASALPLGQRGVGPENWWFLKSW